MSNLRITAQQLSNEARKQKAEVLNKIAKLGEFMELKPNPEKTEYQSNFQYLNSKELSPENISKKAKDSLGAYKNKYENDIQQDYLDALKDSKNDRQVAEIAFNEDAQKIANESKEMAKKVNENAISKGLGRSSIRETALEDIQNTADMNLEHLANELSSKILEIEKEEKDLINKRDTALANFEIEYAVKLQDKIDELTNEITKYNNQVTEYNNKLKEIEEKRRLEHEKQYANAVKENEERNQEILRFLSKYGKGSYSVYAQQQKINAINEFVNSLDKQTALEVMLEDDEIKNVLGESDFNEILRSIQERKD